MTGSTGGTGILPVEPGCGTLDRAFSIGSTEDDGALDLAALTDGSIVVVGEFSRSMTLGAGGPNEVTLTDSCSPYKDGFVAEYSPTGDLSWARQAGGGCFSKNLSDVAIAGQDRVVTLGDRSAADVAFSDGVNVRAFPSMGSVDVHVAVWGAADGTLLWAASGGLDGPEYANAVAAAGDGAVVGVGTFQYDTEFTGSSGPSIALSADPSGEGRDGYLVRWNPDGTLAWATSIIGFGSQDPTAVAIAPDGTVVVAGFFTESIVFAPGTPEEIRMSAGTLPEFAFTVGFLAGYSPSGSLLWAQEWGDNDVSADDPADAVTTVDGVLVAGTVEGGGVFAAGTPREVVVRDDVVAMEYAARWSGAGELQRLVEFFPTTGPTRSTDVIDLDTTGRLAAAGMTTGTWTFAAGTPREVTVSTDDYRDPMLLTWLADGTELCAWPIRNDATTLLVRADGVAFDDLGGVWIAGTFAQNLYLGEGTPNEVVLTSAGGTDIFLARFLVDAPASDSASGTP